jgi:hypothetical protein
VCTFLPFISHTYENRSMCSGVVKKGSWNRLPVAVKSFQMTGVKLSVSDRQVRPEKWPIFCYLLVNSEH